MAINTKIYSFRLGLYITDDPNTPADFQFGSGYISLQKLLRIIASTLVKLVFFINVI